MKPTVVVIEGDLQQRIIACPASGLLITAENGNSLVFEYANRKFILSPQFEVQPLPGTAHSDDVFDDAAAAMNCIVDLIVAGRSVRIRRIKKS
jgi:hypothetical protein